MVNSKAVLFLLFATSMILNPTAKSQTLPYPLAPTKRSMNALPVNYAPQNVSILVGNPAKANMSANINTAKLTQGEVATPDGPRNLSKMIIVRNSSVVVPPRKVIPQQLPSVSVTGWIMDVDYNYYYPSYPTAGSLAFMSAEWIVPPAPPSTGSLVYWFPGLQSNSHIIQPVLQWGCNGSAFILGVCIGGFGGNYWSLANWWAGCASCSYMVSSSIQVNTGDLIYGSLSQSGSTWTIHSEDLTQILSPNNLSVSDTNEYYNSVNTLEGYSISSCSQLSGGVSFESITLQSAQGTVTPSWGVNNLSEPSNQGQCGIDTNSVTVRNSAHVIIDTADPHWYSYSASPNPITLGGSFDITLTVTNEAGTDVSQTAQLSFPSSISSLQVTGTDMSANVYLAGSTVSGCYSTCSVRTSYAFAQGSASFVTGQTHYITVQVYPSEAGQFQVNFKTVALVNGVSQQWASDWDPTSGTTDQQSEYVDTISLTVNSPPSQILTTNVASGSGSVSPNCPSGCSEAVGSSISIMASASVNWQFSSWSISGASCSGGTSSNPCSFTMPNSAVTVQATFTQIVYSVTFYTSPSTDGSIAWGSCSGFKPTLTIRPFQRLLVLSACYVPSGYTFASWTCSSGLSCLGANDPTVVTVSGAGSITLNLKIGSLSSPVSTSLTASARQLVVRRLRL